MYAAYSGGTVLGSGPSLTNERYAVTLPFAFNLDNVNYSSVYIAVNGFISFGNTDPGSGYWMIQSTATGVGIVSGFDANLGGLNAQTELSYHTEGVAPNRKFIAQWKDFGYQGSSALTTNFQIQLNEGSNIIKISYGNISLGASSVLGVMVGLRGINNSIFNNRSSSAGNWLATTTGTSNTANINYTAGNNPPNTLSFTYTPPPTCLAPNPISGFTLTSTSSSVSGNWTAPVPTPYKYLVVRTPGSSALIGNPTNGTNYIVGSTLSNGIIVSNSSSTSFSNSGLSQNTYYTYTIFAYTDATCMSGPMYCATPVASTMQTQGPRKYVWNAPGGNGDFTVANNWSPSRTFSYPLDTLVFSNGGNAVVTNMNSPTLSKFEVSNQTQVNLSGGGADSLIIQNTLFIQYGSSFTLNAPGTLKIKYASSGGIKSGVIDGTLALADSSVYDANYSNTTVSGQVNVSGNASAFKNSASALSPAIFFLANSMYHHNRNGGEIPAADFNPLSTIKLSQIININPVMNGMNWGKPSIGHLSINCPTASIVVNISAWCDTVAGDAQIYNTGTGSVRFQNIIFMKSYSHLHGITRFSNCNLYGDAWLDTGRIYIDSLLLGGDLTSTSSDSIYGAFTMFNGNSLQHVSINGFVNTIGGYKVILNNLSGVELTGVIPIGSYGSVTILNGHFSGTGRFSYISSNSSLNYDVPSSYQAGAVEWPDINSPSSVIVKINSVAPYNRFYIPGTRTVQGLSFQGVVVLDNHDLYCIDGIGPSVASTTGNPYFVATNGSGKLYQHFWGIYESKIFPVGDIQGVDQSSPFELLTIQGSSEHWIGVRVFNQQHPSDTATSNYLSRYWEITDTASTSLKYIAKFRFDPVDWFGNSTGQIKAWNGSNWSLYPSGTLSNDLVTDTLTTSLYTLNGRAFTAHTLAASTTYDYHWNGSVSHDFQLAANWTPARNSPSIFDILHFDNGVTDSIINYNNSILTGLRVYNNTNVIFDMTPFRTLTLRSDNNNATSELLVTNGSSLLFKDLSFELSFDGNGCKADIYGELEFYEISHYHTIDLSNCVMTVYAGAVLKSTTNGNVQANQFISNDTTLIIYGDYESRVTNTANNFPYASWKDGSNANIKHATNYTATVSFITMGLNQSFYNMEYDCPLQTGVADWYMNKIDTIRNEFRVISTGTGSFLPCSNWGQYDKAVIRKLVIQGGKMNLNNFSYPPEWIITDTLIHTGGDLFASYRPYIIHFAGNHPNSFLSCTDSSLGGKCIYKISNSNGIHLVGNGTLNTQPFRVHNEGGIDVATTASFPINTLLNIAYDSNSSTLFYSAQSNLTADTICFPSTFGPAKVRLDIGSHILDMPFDRTIATELRFMSGKLNIGSHHLTIGRSVSQVGSLFGGMIQMNGGTLTRWYPSTGLATSASPYSNGYYPIEVNNNDRTVQLYFSTSNALSSGGTISVSHNDLAGSTSGLSLLDGAYSITDRTNYNWQLSAGNGLALAGTMGMRCTIDGVPLFTNNTTLRLMQPNSFIGNHITGGGTLPLFYVERNALSLNDLTSQPLHIGYNSSNQTTTMISITDGDWNSPSTWNTNTIPSSNDVVYISTNDSVTLTSNGVAKSLTILQQGVLNVQHDTLTLNQSYTSSGNTLMTGGTLILGPMGGGNRTFYNDGRMLIDSGTVIVNGNFVHNFTDSLIQTGGLLVIDPYNNTTPSLSSQYSSIHIINSKVKASGGKIKIVDPPYTNGVYSIESDYAFTPLTLSASHTIEFGDSVSTASNSYPFSIYMGNAYSTLGNIVVNATPSSTSRQVQLAQHLAMVGDLSLLHPNAQFDMNLKRFSIAGNIKVDSAAKFISRGKLFFSKRYEDQNYAATSHQLITGSGFFGNTISAPTSNFDTVVVINTSAQGVTFDIGNVTVKGIQLVKGRVNMNTDTLIQHKLFATPPDSGWVNGVFKSYVTNTPNAIIFPIGDSTQVFYCKLYGSVASVSHDGYITLSSHAGDHPFLSGSSILANKSVNRYFSIDTSAGLTCIPANQQWQFHWKNNDVDAAAVTSNFFAEKYNNSLWTPFNALQYSNTSLNLWLPATQLSGDYAFGENSLQPVINSQPTNQIICAGDNAIFTVNANGVNAYQWQVFDGSVWSSLNTSAIYTGVHSSQLNISNTPISFNGNLYRCILYYNSDSVISNAVSLMINVMLTPTITIASSVGTTICANSMVTFSATISNGGSTPFYQWKLNGQPVGSNSNTFSTMLLSNNDVISCDLMSSLSCAVPNSVSSSPLTMTVNPLLTPSVTIMSNPGDTICLGTNTIFTATAINGGSNPLYQWFKNGVPVIGSGNTYTDNALQNNDQLHVILTSNETCLVSNNSSSNVIHMTVNNLLTPSVTIAVSPNDTICAGTLTTFNSSIQNQGLNTTYSWYVNGSLAGSGSSYSGNSFSNADQISLNINTNPLCASTTNALSNMITLTVNPIVNPAISISISPSDTICQGATVTCNATISGGGSNPTYQWFVNGIPVGTNSSTFTTNTFNNNDIISCELLSNDACASMASILSNTIPVTVNPILTPAINIVATPSVPVCAGTTITFNASYTNGGTNPSFQWTLNGSNAGSNSSTYISNSLSNGDQVNCVITSSAQCVSPSTVQSNTISVMVSPVVTPSVSISANPGNVINLGQTVTFTAVPVNGGSSPSYQWAVNGSNVGTNSSTFQSSALNTGDEVTVDMTSSDSCVTTFVVSSNLIKMTIVDAVQNYENAGMKIYVYPNPTSGLLHIDIELKSIDQTPLNCIVRSILGEVVYNETFEVHSSGLNFDIRLPKDLSDGLYTIEFIQSQQRMNYLILLKR